MALIRAGDDRRQAQLDQRFLRDPAAVERARRAEWLAFDRMATLTVELKRQTRRGDA